MCNISRQSCVVVEEQTDKRTAAGLSSELVVDEFRGLFALSRLLPDGRFRVVVHYRPGGYQLGAVRKCDLMAVAHVAPTLSRRQAAGRRGERVCDAVRGQVGRAAGARVLQAPTETVVVLWVRRVISGRALHHLWPVSGHRDAAGRYGDVRGGTGRGVLVAVRRPAGAHDRRAAGSCGGYAAGARDRHATAAHHKPLDLRASVAVVLGGLLVRRPAEQL